MSRPFAQLTVPRRSIVLGALVVGTAGGIVGLVIGLFTYAPTAPFALIEAGLPATIAGALIGLIVGTLILAGRQLARLTDHECVAAPGGHYGGRRGRTGVTASAR
ncbi:MAG: hypothetical protein ACRDP1_15005 [Nocardioidaceae bacterium]